jgi:hypothetical protein
MSNERGSATVSPASCIVAIGVLDGGLIAALALYGIPAGFAARSPSCSSGATSTSH